MKKEEKTKQTSVTVWFWILDIVLSLDQSDIILLTYFFRKRIDIFRKTADHTDTCNITDIFFYGLYTDLYIFSFHLLQDTNRFLDSAFN